jgi:hypothetical protein
LRRVTLKKGNRFAVALSGPLMPDHPAEPSIALLREARGALKVVVVNELLVRGNVPAALREIQERLALRVSRA